MKIRTLDRDWYVATAYLGTARVAGYGFDRIDAINDCIKDMKVIALVSEQIYEIDNRVK